MLPTNPGSRGRLTTSRSAILFNTIRLRSGTTTSHREPPETARLADNAIEEAVFALPPKMEKLGSDLRLCGEFQLFGDSAVASLAVASEVRQTQVV